LTIVHKIAKMKIIYIIKEDVVFMSEEVIVFELEHQSYGINTNEISEISKVMPITPLPSQNMMEGIVNIRGSIHSVISLRKMFGMKAKEQDSNSRLIIMGEKKLALLADEVTTMAIFEEEEKQDINKISLGNKDHVIAYIAKWNNNLISVVDVKSLLENKAVSPS
jgi:purine-binding chemotaxis protein CheW